MKYDEFIGQVQHRAQLPEEGDATYAARATLMTLGERLAGNEPLDAASQLPDVLKEFLTDGREAGEGIRFSLEDFYRKVANREGTDIETARRHAIVVMSVLREALTPGEWEDICAQLPDEYNELTNC